MEGGSIEVNGAGVVMTTEQCLLNANRSPQLDREGIEDHLKSYLGVQQVLWLGEGIVGDDTDGHIDDIARFVAADTIICALEEDPADASYKLLRQPEEAAAARNPAGLPFEIVTLPMPGVLQPQRIRVRVRSIACRRLCKLLYRKQDGASTDLWSCE